MRIRRSAYEVNLHGIHMEGYTFTAAGSHRRTLRLIRRIKKVYETPAGRTGQAPKTPGEWEVEYKP